MYSEHDEASGISPAEAYRRAKADHYYQHAQECFDMGRYLAAMKSLDSVFTLEKDHLEARELRKSIAGMLQAMALRSRNGHAASKGEGAPQARPRRSELVMVVDQDERLLSSLTATLRRYGFLAISASSYEEAVESYGTAKPDVVISEVNFEAGPRGFDLYLWLKTNAGKENLPFLFLATRIDRDTLIAGKRFGVDDLILKPVDDDVVIASVINCLSRRKAMPLHS
ncbi:MAG: response regulator [Bacteroidota bacterium]